MKTTLAITAALVIGAALFIETPRPELMQTPQMHQAAFTFEADAMAPNALMVQDQATRPPGTSWVYRADEIQALALKWLAVLSAVALAALGVIAAIWAKLAELKDRMNRQSLKTGSLETRLTAVAMAHPAPSEATQKAVLAADPLPRTTPGPLGPVVAFLVSLGTMVGLTACAMTEQTKSNWSATGTYLAAKAAKMTTSLVLNAAVSSFRNNADFGQSLGEGLRTLEGTMVTGEDVRHLVDIWTPDRPEWDKLGGQLAQTFDQVRTGDPKKDAAVIEALAVGVQTASMEAAR